MHGSTRAWLVRTPRIATINPPLSSGNELLVSGCGCSVSGTHRNSAAGGGQLPGATGGAHARRPGCRWPMQAAGPDPWPGGCGCGSGATMNALAVQDIEAADLLALARLDDGGAPGRCGPPWSQPGRPGPDPSAQEPMDPRSPPETSGGDRRARAPPREPPV